MKKPRKRIVGTCSCCGLRDKPLVRGLCDAGPNTCYRKQLQAARPDKAEPTPLRTTLFTPAAASSLFDRGVNHQVLYQSATTIVESVLDPVTGQEVNRLICVGDSWPEPPLRAVLAGDSEAA